MLGVSKYVSGGVFECRGEVSLCSWVVLSGMELTAKNTLSDSHAGRMGENQYGGH